MDIFKNYESLWKSIIRPTRQTYNTSDLGPQIVLTQESREKVKRQDFELKNKLGLVLKCSYYEFIQRNTPQPCVVYLHCNSGSRLEGQLYVDYLINKGISVCIFDFAGSGQSEGEYISLGYYELGDVEIVVNYLKQNWQISKIGIWGRSMGAVTGLMYIQNNSSIICGCFDSPFSDFMKLASEIGAMKTGLPKFLIKGALSLIQSTILEKAKFNIEELDVLKNLDKANVPCLFVASKQDSFVKSHHTEKIQKNYKGESKMLYFDGDHHEQRPVRLVKQCCEFFEQNLIKNQISEVPSQIKQLEGVHMYNQQQQNQQQFDQSSPLQGKTISTQSQQQLLQNNTFQQQQALQRSRIKSVQAPNLVSHLQSSVERGNSNNNIEFYNSVKDQKSNQFSQPVPSSQPLIHVASSNNNIANQTIHHAHSRSSTPNIQINLEKKFNNVVSSEQKVSGPAAPMIPQTAISAFENKQGTSPSFNYKNFEQKNSGRINSVHQANNLNNNIFNFNQPTQATNNPLNIVLLQDSNSTPSQQQFISNQLQSNQNEQNSSNNSQQGLHQQQRSITVVGQQQHINVLGNTANNNFYGRERSNTSFTGALDFYKDMTSIINNQYSTSNSNIKNNQNQAPQTPIGNNQNINCDTSIDFGQSKIPSTHNSATPSCNSLAKQQSQQNQNNIQRQANSPHASNLQQQHFLQQQMLQTNTTNTKNGNQQNLYKSQSLNVNENLVTGTSHQGENSIIVKSIPINYGVSSSSGAANNHMKKDSKTQFDMFSQPQSVESSVYPPEVQNRFRATTMDIIQPQRNESQHQVNDQCLTPQSNTFTTNNITYKINRPRIQNSINSNQPQNPNNELNIQKLNIFKQNSFIAEELTTNNNSSMPSSSANTTFLNNQGSSINSSFNQNRNNQFIVQMNTNNKSSINANNHSIVCLSEQQTNTLVSPRQANNISMAGSVMNLSNNNILLNNQLNMTSNNNNSIQHNTRNFDHYVRIGQQMNKECKNENSKISNAEGDNESIISCDSLIINKNFMINNSSSKKPGTMNHTPVVCVTTPHMSKSSNNHNQMQSQNSGKKAQQSAYQNSSKNFSQSSQKYCNTLPSKNIDGLGNNNKYDESINCFTPRSKKNINPNNNGTNQKNGSEKVNSTSNQKSKSNKNNNQQNNANALVNQFSIFTNTNQPSQKSSTQLSNSKQMNKQNTNNVLQSNQNVENKNKQQSAQKNVSSNSNHSGVQSSNTQNLTPSNSAQQSLNQTDAAIKGQHQKNQSKFDFKNKRSANNIPIQRVKFTKNENISPFQQENYNSGVYKNIANVKVNLFDIECKSPTNNQQGNCFGQQQVNKQDQNSNQSFLDNFVTAPLQLQHQQIEDKNHSNTFNKDKQSNNNSKLNEALDINNQSKPFENKFNQTLNNQDDSKKNRSSTTPTFKPDFIRNLQNTKVVHILSKNEELQQQQNYIQQSKIVYPNFSQTPTQNNQQNQNSLNQQNNSSQNYNLQNQYSNMYNNINQNLNKNGFNVQSNQMNNIVYMNQFK